MGKRTTTTANTVSATYHDGPPEIEFLGRRWQKGVSQTITDTEFSAMQHRTDVGFFGFTYAADPAPAPSEEN